MTPWWYPILTDASWCEDKRKEYPSEAHLDDEALRNRYADGAKYQTLWDNLGDARDEHEHLADAYLELLRTVQRAGLRISGEY
jgi:hypothetical protein